MNESRAGTRTAAGAIAADERASAGASVLVGLWGAFLALVPLPLASNRPLFWCINAVVVGCFVLAAAFLHGPGPRFRPIISGVLALCGLLGAALLGWMLAQALLPVGPGSPLAEPIWGAASTALGEPLAGRISADPWASLLAALRFATAMGAFWVTLRLAAVPGGGGALLRWLVWASAAYALYGIALTLLGSRTILWLDKWTYIDSLTATFVNRNAAAAYFGIGLLAALAEAAAAARRRTARSFAYFCLLLVPIALLANALVLTGSRSGVGATALAAGLGLLLLLGARRMPALVVPLLLVALAGLALAALQLSGAHLFARLDADAGSAESRPWLYRAVAAMIADRPWTGFGAGTFRLVFPAWREPGQEMFLTWAQTHNVYLELAVELGLPATVAMVLMTGALVLVAARGLRVSRKLWHVALFAVTAWALLAVQGLVDFALQYQAITLTAVAALAMGTAAAAHPQALQQRQQTEYFS